MKKKADPAQVKPVVSQISWYEIIPLDLKDLTYYLTGRFKTEEDANNYLCRDKYFEPHKFKVMKVIAG
jgi:hypothetical protein